MEIYDVQIFHKVRENLYNPYNNKVEDEFGGSVHVPSEDSEDDIGNEEESRVAVEPKATSNTKLEVTRDVESISATTKYKPRESGKELIVEKDNVGSC